MEPVQLLKTVLEELRQISTRLNDLSTANTKTQERSYLSPQVNEIYTALAKAQCEMEYASRDSENPHWKSSYANLESVIRASRPYLAKHGICMSHRLEITKEGQTILVCTLGHISGQYIESIMRVIPDKSDIQAFGKYLTYIRRYSYISLCGLADTDDDGESAMVEARNTAAKGTGLNTKYNPKDQSLDTLSKEQVDEMEYELAEYPDLSEQILDGLRIQSIADIPKSKYRAAITRIREIKELRNTGAKRQ